MKKAILTIAVAAFAFAANAQFVIGGQVNYNTWGYNTANTAVTSGSSTEFNMPGDNTNNQNKSTLKILPKIGYNLNDKMQVGASFGITWDKTTDYSAYAAQYAANLDGFEGWQRETQTGIQIAPYFRYNFAEFKGFTLFCEAQVAFTFGLNSKERDYHTAYTMGGISFDAVDEDLREGRADTYTNIDITVVPGLNYKLNDKFSVDLYIDLLGLGFTHRSEKAFRDWNIIGNAPANTPENTTTNVYTSNNFYCMANANAQTLNAHLGAFRLGFNYHF